MKILITGGLGFQASHLAEYLLDKGHQITVLNTYSEKVEKDSALLKDKVKIVFGSITDREIVDKTSRDQDVIFHFAARINVDESIKQPLDHISVNVLGTYNVLEAVKTYGSKLILASSCEAYGGKDVPIIETDELRPQSPYAASKAAADRLAYAYHKTYGVKVVIVRPFNIFGERQKEKMGGAVIPIFISKAMGGESLTIFGTGEQTRDYTYISDLVRAYVSILENFEKLNGEVINFGTGKETSIKSIAEYIAKKFGVEVKHETPRPGEVKQFICNYDKAKKLLDWEPQVSIWEGIDKVIEWRRKQS